jgi:hypothetical protein
MFLQDVVFEVLKNYPEANLRSDGACRLIAEEIESEYNQRRMEWFVQSTAKE